MKILFIGDIVGVQGSEFVQKNLYQIKRKENIDVVIANGENSAKGNGITPESAKMIFSSGVDVITTGNHAFRRREIYSYFDSTPQLIRPGNYPSCNPGNSYYIIDKGSYTVAVVNISGVAFMEPLACPFETMEKLLKKIDTTYIVVDFHGESTGEKGAFAHYFDGKITAIFGTHTHVQTADEQILPKGTAFISDAGMTGPKFSVLGVRPECIINKMKNKMPTRFEVSDNQCVLNGVVLEIDNKYKKCSNIYRIIY